MTPTATSGAVHGAARRVQQPQSWEPSVYRAPTPFGPLVLSLQPAPGVELPSHEVLRAALLLAQAEALVQLLEDWLQAPIDLEPGSPGAAGPSAAAHVSLGPAGGGPVLQAQVHLPWAWLQALPPREPALAQQLQALKWQPLATRLVLSRQGVQAAEWAQLCQPGAALLLPESFEPAGWPCALRPLDSVGEALLPQDLGAQWQPHAARLQWLGQPSPAAAATGEVMLEVLLRQPLMLTPPELLAWAGMQVRECAGGAALLERVGVAHAVVHPAQLLPLGLRADGRAGHLLRME
ncbi:hypothetical protein [Ideonella sp. BN130291]|uniref:hypothetical protein n=1 Tax=Ideonella sp. BN130291 TaxID=3112940 RepID=UPI002E25428B|nr:hypothetical protein [Ideonella sp. BN130291]